MHKGNKSVKYYEINSLYGHDTFLLDVNNVGAAVKVMDYIYDCCLGLLYSPIGSSRITLRRCLLF